jgi:hypothetical protein
MDEQGRLSACTVAACRARAGGWSMPDSTGGACHVHPYAVHARCRVAALLQKRPRNPFIGTVCRDKSRHGGCRRAVRPVGARAGTYTGAEAVAGCVDLRSISTYTASDCAMGGGGGWATASRCRVGARGWLLPQAAKALRQASRRRLSRQHSLARSSPRVRLCVRAYGDAGDVRSCLLCLLLKCAGVLHASYLFCACVWL